MTAIVLVGLLALGGFLVSRIADGSQAVATEAVTIAQATRPAVIMMGSCEAPGDIAWPLNDLTSPPGGAVGSIDADRTEYSFTANVPFALGDLMSSPHAVQVQESAEQPEAILACGNIGGIQDGLGTLVIGLRWQVGLDISGIAVLSPSPADHTRTLISVFITGSALGTMADVPRAAPTTIVAGPPDNDTDEVDDDGDDSGDDDHEDVDTDDDGPDDHGGDTNTDDDDPADDSSGSDSTESGD
ncbi:MAG TPA: hypothetical protein PK819_00085 [Thermomicrobiales bacterium]|nr:hypothetical protein [Thermomicrobiales bacterium]